ncbi:phytanoyl-CoA dioxygenase family protein [Oceanospirillum sediminis]|uniref:Phytanoyl-CoA dioxygenase family protein n=1 Tax=Oceanospirillum sediminis TaxID=2760088 RepID=A0A839INP7_9GAMM|nr:phytanoyl-CoA dioxygenase family protein [Oceanospirillum sediminis]
MQQQETDLYPSRQGKKETITHRHDPVVYPYHKPELESTLSPEQIARYINDGFLVLPDYMSDWVEALQYKIGQLKQIMSGREELITEPDSNALRTIFNPIEHNQLVKNFFSHPRILNIARRLLGSEVYAMQSRVNIKPPFTGRSFPWHSDFETWHVEDGMPRMRAVTAWIMLTDNHEKNGPLYVIPGSHKQFVCCEGSTKDNNFATSLKKQMLGVPLQHSMKELMGNKEITSVTGKAGTVVFHECNIMHGSPDNISADPRSILMCVYNSMENIAQKPFSDLQPRPHYLNSRHPAPLHPLNDDADTHHDINPAIAISS